MDLQPDTFACFGIHRIERVRIPSLRIWALRLLGLALPIYCTNMHTFFCLPFAVRVQRVPSAFTRSQSVAYSIFGLLHARFRPGRVPGERVPSSHVTEVVPSTPGPTSTPCTWSGLLSCMPLPCYSLASGLVYPCSCQGSKTLTSQPNRDRLLTWSIRLVTGLRSVYRFSVLPSPRDMYMIAHYGQSVNIQTAQNMSIVFDYGHRYYKEVKPRGQL